MHGNAISTSPSRLASISFKIIYSRFDLKFDLFYFFSMYNAFVIRNSRLMGQNRSNIQNEQRSVNCEWHHYLGLGNSNLMCFFLFSINFAVDFSDGSHNTHNKYVRHCRVNKKFANIEKIVDHDYRLIKGK